MQINRLLEIIFILLQKKKISTKELAQQLGVSRRTICRDIDILSVAGIPICTERGKGGGISLLPSFVLNKSILSDQEQDEILTALHGLSNVKSGSGVLAKMSAIFNKTAQDWVSVDFSDWHCGDNFFDCIKVAIINRRIVEFDYFNSRGEKSTRRVELMQLWFKSKSWYLKGFCLTRQGARVYKLTRIKNITVTNEPFDWRIIAEAADKHVQKNDKRQLGDLKLRIGSELAFRVYDDFDESNVEKQADGSFLVTVPNVEASWVYGSLLSYGRHLEVLEPESVRAVLKDEAENILKKYL